MLPLVYMMVHRSWGSEIRRRSKNCTCDALQPQHLGLMMKDLSPYLGVAGGAAGVHDGAQVLGLGREGLSRALPAQLKELCPRVHLQAGLVLHVLHRGMHHCLSLRKRAQQWALVTLTQVVCCMKATAQVFKLHGTRALQKVVSSPAALSYKR